MTDKDEPLYLISIVSRMLNVHPQTLRLYEREGFIKPTRTNGKTRLYSRNDIKQLETILTFTRELGVNLAGVEVILELKKKLEALQKERDELLKFASDKLGDELAKWREKKA